MTPEQRAARVHYHEYSGEGIREHAERIVALEELVLDLYEIAQPEAPSMFEAEFADRMRELGVIE